MATLEERWPPIYDAEDLAREISRLSGRDDLIDRFYEWCEDRSTLDPQDVCQGDVVELHAEVPVILADGGTASLVHRESIWLVIGNTCDFARDITQVRWTQIVPIVDLGGSELSPPHKDALRKYSQSRVFYVPPWSTTVADRFHAADLLRPVAIDKRALLGGPARVRARIDRKSVV